MNFRPVITIIGLLAFLVGSTTSYSQVTVTFTDGGTITIPCGDPNTFDDGYGGAYGANLSDTMTICSDGINGLAVALVFAPEVGGAFDVDPSDTLYVYDGPNTQSPLLGAYNNGTHPFGTLTVNSSIDNESGCLTLVFASDGSNEAAGFTGTVGCYFQCQPIEPIVTSVPAIFPADSSGTIDICLGDTVWLTANANFPLSAANGGVGYNQTLENSQIEWQIAGGFQIVGENGYFVPDQNAGYYVDLQITDTLGCFEYFRTGVRVTTVPSYQEMAAALDDTVCVGESAIILGGINAILTDTSGVDPTTGEYIIGGLFAEQLELPDGGSGTLADIYNTTITISGAEPTDSITFGEEIINLCVEMEHSYLGDLEMWLTCPSGDSALIFDGYNSWAASPGFFPGGFPTQTGINLGLPGVGSNIGECWSYCFSITNNNFGSFQDEYSGMGNEMSAGTYLPEQSFDNLIGCPVNGDWSLRLADNFGGDDGWICQWSLELADSLTPEPVYYTPLIVDGWWESDPSIISNLGDTAIEVLPPSPGNHSYTFYIEDEFGCQHDTTIVIHQVPSLTSFVNDETCGEEYDLTAADYEILGEWSFNGPVGGTATFDPSNTSYETTATIDVYGGYEFIYQSAYCGQSDTIVVDFNPVPSNVVLNNQTICPGESLTFDAENEDIGASYTWLPGGSTNQTLTLDSIVATTGVQVTIENDCGTANGAATITVENLDVSGPTDVCLDDVADLSAVFTTSGGVWSFSGPEGSNASFSPSETDDSPSATATFEGAYQFIFTDNDCGMKDSVNVFFTPTPTIEIVLDTNRICVEDDAILTFTTNTQFYDEFSWLPFGTAEDTLIVPGTDSLAFNMLDTSFHVTATVSNYCGDDSDEVVYNVIDCNLEVPNVFNPESTFPENRYFNIVALELHPGNNMKIFDRWGRKCYDVDDYHLSPWNGGKESDGVFYYVLERPGYEAETGYVHLVRSAN